VNAPPTAKYDYDVVIIGGALSGAATAIQILHSQPDLRLLIIEKSGVFTRRVGEATVEISAYFLSRVIGLTQYLNDAHLVKQGMRFWFANNQTHSLEDSSEIGGRYMARVPAYQVDRALLDEEVLRRAVALGAELWRPASVGKVELNSGGSQVIAVRRGENSLSISTRWVIDASGLAALLSRQNGWWHANTEHPTTAVWARWRNVKDWDSLELAQKFPKWSMDCHGVRNTATNHFVGNGWWAWCIPLKGGDVSVGIVFDQRMVEFPEEGSVGDRLKTFLCQHAVGREIMSDAEWVEGDVHWRKNLPYYSSRYAGDGYAIVGDAGAFIDPFYSPGMDWVSFTSVASAELILAQLRGEPITNLVDKHNRDFVRAHQRWFEAVYKDKYFFMGDYDLMRLAFLLDLGLYYIGVASQPFKRGRLALKEPVFSTPPSVPFYHLMRTYARRLAAMGQSRRQRGVWGRHNHGRRFLFGGYTFAGKSSLPILQALVGWGILELSEGWRTWFGRKVEPSLAEVKEKKTISKTVEHPAAAH
jgi:flavin-dependent dehydrogenase